MTDAKILIEEFAAKQCSGDYPCPRCGRRKMADNPFRNAMSRRAKVQVCDECGMAEAFEDMPGGSKLPLSSWAIVMDPAPWNVQPAKMQLRLVGRDSWSRPVYECNERLYVDIEPRKGRPPCICTKQGNAFDGEPCDPVEGEFIFIPERDTW